MNTIASLDKKIANYVGQLNTKQKKVVLSVAKAFADEEAELGHWQDEGFVEEMNRRYNDYKNGKSQLIPLEEVEAKARQAAKAIKKAS